MDSNTDRNVCMQEEIEFQQLCRQLLNCPHWAEHLGTGSFFELPFGCFVENVTDYDTMACNTQFLVLPQNHRQATKPVRRKDALLDDTQFSTTAHYWPRETVLRINSRHSHPGFTQLLYDDDFQNGKVFSYHDRNSYKKDKNYRASHPTVAMKKSDSLLRFLQTCWIGGSHFPSEVFMADWVGTIHCPVWPQEANEWRVRRRSNGWPSDHTKELVVNSGCYFVTKPHEKRSSDSDWRFSFSGAELILINSWSRVQQYIYHVLRLIKDDIVKRCGRENHGCLKTYHFKTLMLWTCEEKPPEFWKIENICDALKELLCTMIGWMIEKECRNYFIPSNNMWDYLPDNYNFEPETTNMMIMTEALHGYIDYTAHFRRLNFEKNGKEILQVPIPNKLLSLIHLRCYHSFLLNPSLPGRQRYLPSNALYETEYFTSMIVPLYKALCIHRRFVSQTFETKLRNELIENIADCFKCCREAKFEGFTDITISLLDNIHDIFGKVLQIPIGYQHNMRRTTVRNDTVLKESICSAIFCHANNDVEHPFYFICCAYEANFHYTAFESYPYNAVDHLKTALKLCKDALSHAAELRTKYTNWVAVSSEMLPVIATKKLMTIFDKHINAALQPHSGSSDGVELQDFVVHFSPEDFMKYVEIQCLRKLCWPFDEDEEFALLEHSVDLNPTRRILCEALRISKES